MADIPGNSSTTASVTVGGTVSGTLETIGDHDWFRLSLTAGQSVTIFLDGTTLEDPYLRVRDSSGNLLYENDDISSGVNRDSQLSFTATYTGTHFIDVGAWNEGYTGNYELSVTPYTPPPLATNDQIADQLTDGYWGGDDHHFNVTQGGSISVNITALTPAGQNLAREALATWSHIIGVSFTEVAAGGQITFDDNQQGAFSESNWSGGIISSSFVNVSNQWLADYGTGPNTYSFQTYIHEIGHALGLGHAGNYNGSANYPYDALFQNDSWATSVMSYFDQTENTYFAGQGFTENFLLTPMMADIQAMSTLYGLSTTWASGDTTYVFSGIAGSGAQCIYDAGGNDWLYAHGYFGSQLINLNPGTYSNIYGDVGNVSIAFGVTIENAVGGSGSDTMIGNSSNNRLEARDGADILDGGLGVDTLVGNSGNDRFIVDQSGDMVVELAGEGDDRLIAGSSYTLGAGVSIETMTTVNASATTAINLTGNELGQSLYGNAGANVLTGLGGADYMVGGAGNDRYYVDTSDFVSELAGGGDDTIFVATSYILRAGAEIETLVAVNQASLDPVNFTGNEYGQSLYGSQGANALNGGGGSDYLVGLGGNDILIGGAGNDNMAGGQGNDVYYADAAGDQVIEAAGEGDDRVVAYASFALGAGSSVETLAAAGGAGAIALTGNGQAQSLYGNAGANVLTGGGGADYLVGGGGDDVFVLSGGSVATIADYASGDIADVTQILSLVAGTDVIGGGYLRVTAGGQLQADVDGGGDGWVTLANVSGSGSVTIRYLSGGAATSVSVARTASASTAAMAGAVAAAGLAAKAAAATASDDMSGGVLASASATLAVDSTEGPDLSPAPFSRSAVAGEREAIDDGAAIGATGIIGKDAPTADAMPLAPQETALPSALEQGTELAAAGAPAAAALLAHAIAMPSADMLLAPDHAGADGTRATAEVARVLVDALAGGEAGGAIDALLGALPASGAAATGLGHLAPLAGFGADGGPVLGAFADAPLTIAYVPETLALHPDAPAAV